MLTVDAGLAYRDVLTSDWTTKFHSVEERPLRCAFALPKVNCALKGFHVLASSRSLCVLQDPDGSVIKKNIFIFFSPLFATSWKGGASRMDLDSEALIVGRVY